MLLYEQSKELVYMYIIYEVCYSEADGLSLIVRERFNFVLHGIFHVIVVIEPW